MSSEGYAIKVTGIDHSTTEFHLKEFFTFCGTIKHIQYEKEKKEARIVFEKHSAAKTAVMLDEGTLDGATLRVHPEFKDEPAEASTSHIGGHDAPIEQSDKPRAAIAAEYLAKGYALKDHILQRAIKIDAEQGISARFLSYFKSIDTMVGSKVLGPDQTVSGKVTATVSNVATTATTQAKKVDEQRGISTKAQEYYSKALSSPWGRTVFDFYSSTQKQILDIHEEAKRIAEHNKTETVIVEEKETEKVHTA